MSHWPLYAETKPLGAGRMSGWKRLAAVAVLMAAMVLLGSGLGSGLASNRVIETGTTYSTAAFKPPPQQLNELVDVQPDVVILTSIDEVTLTQNDERVLQGYRVQSGDTLWEIAAQQLGSGMRWQEIYEANLAAIGPDPNFLEVGILLQGIQSPPLVSGQP
jgi:hypothetical protein